MSNFPQLDTCRIQEKKWSPQLVQSMQSLNVSLLIPPTAGQFAEVFDISFINSGLSMLLPFLFKASG
jgi:hypothetical protein